MSPTYTGRAHDMKALACGEATLSLQIAQSGLRPLFAAAVVAGARPIAFGRAGATIKHQSHFVLTSFRIRNLPDLVVSGRYWAIGAIFSYRYAATQLPNYHTATASE
ncbi:MAG: hypothetical protein ABI670_21830 [Chloroflexota bacterium]